MGVAPVVAVQMEEPRAGVTEVIAETGGPMDNGRGVDGLALPLRT